MSLLLDALKKAAEKKAEKDGDAPQGAAVDETVVNATQLDQTEQSAAGSSDETLQQGVLHDDTQLDATHQQPADDDDPGQQSLRDAIESDVADETIVDQTLLDQTEFDNTELQTQLMAEQEPSADVSEQAEVAEDSTQTQAAEQTGLMGSEDETMVFDDEDLSEFLGEPRYINGDNPEDTEVATQSMQSSDDTDVATQSMPPAGDDTDMVTQSAPSDDDTQVGNLDYAEDMSLLLVDDEQTQTGVKTLTSVTDPRHPPTRGELPEEQSIPGGPSAEAATQTGPTTRTAGSVTTQVGGRTESTMTRSDSTGTATYAPDNYDRTLMRVQTDDASRIFAGMESDTDTVMTPDHAKQVFQSKSSAKRWKNFRSYSGIVIAILLAVGILGLFQFQDEVESIDSSLRPLTRDPMPGPITISRQGEGENLFNAPEEVDERTRQLVETANQIGSEGSIAEEQPEPTETVAVSEVDVEPAVEPEVSQAAESIAVTRVEPAIETTTVDSGEVTPPVAALQSETGPESTLSITTNMRTADKDIWLREAYAAYRSGDDALALQKYNQVLEVDPGNRNALLARAAIAIQNNRSSDAVRDYQRLLEANPRDSLAMSSMMAISSVAPRQAESQLKLMLRDEPNSPHLNFSMGNVYGMQNRWQEAQRHYFTALENNPDDPNYAYNLAVSLEHISKPQVAAGFYQRALENFDMGLATFSRQVVEQRLGALQ